MFLISRFILENIYEFFVRINGTVLNTNVQILSRCPWSGFCCWSFIYSACSVYSYLFIFWTVTWQSPGPCDTHTHIKKHLSSQYLAVLQEFKLSQKRLHLYYTINFIGLKIVVRPLHSVMEPNVWVMWCTKSEKETNLL